MINAEKEGGDTEYILADINTYNSGNKYDFIHSMEVLYYLDKPFDTIKKIVDSLGIKKSAWFSRSKLLLAQKKITDYLMNRGYAKTKVESTFSNPKGGVGSGVGGSLIRWCGYCRDVRCCVGGYTCVKSVTYRHF